MFLCRANQHGRRSRTPRKHFGDCNRPPSVLYACCTNNTSVGQGTDSCSIAPFSKLGYRQEATDNLGRDADGGSSNRAGSVQARSQRILGCRFALHAHHVNLTRSSLLAFVYHDPSSNRLDTSQHAQDHRDQTKYTSQRLNSSNISRTR